MAETTKPKTVEDMGLEHFTGSDEFYKHLFGVIYTEGIQHVAELCGAYWLIDIVASYQPVLVKSQRTREFQLWELIVTETKDGSREAVVTCREDTGEPPVVTQKIPYTDFPIGSFEFYATANHLGGTTMLLKGEY